MRWNAIEGRKPEHQSDNECAATAYVQLISFALQLLRDELRSVDEDVAVVVDGAE